MSNVQHWCDVSLEHIAKADHAEALRRRAVGLSLEGFGEALALIAAKQTRVRSVAGNRDITISVWIERSIDQDVPDADGSGVDILRALENLAVNLRDWHIRRAREATRCAMDAKEEAFEMAVAS